MPGEDDDGVWVDNTQGTSALAPNSRCPLSFKGLLDISEPVQDTKGFVYEREAILKYISSKPGGVVDAPVSGSSHKVRAADLKPAKAVLKAQKKAASQRRSSGAGREGPEADVVDDDDDAGPSHPVKGE